MIQLLPLSLSFHRRAIPLSTLVRFQNHYGDEAITKWDIFHYVYAVLHHPEYRTRYVANLRRELPRIPMVAPGPSSVPNSVWDRKKGRNSVSQRLGSAPQATELTHDSLRLLNYQCQSLPITKSKRPHSPSLPMAILIALKRCSRF